MHSVAKPVKEEGKSEEKVFYFTDIELSESLDSFKKWLYGKVEELEKRNHLFDEKIF